MNSIILTGTIESEKIEIRNIKKGTPITSFILKVKNETVKNTSAFVTIVCWNKMADYVVNNFKKGDKVVVNGSLHIGKRKLNGYSVFKNGEEIPDYEFAFCDVNAVHVEKL